MAASAILDLAAASAQFTITLPSLASSTAGVGRQSNMIANTSPAHNAIKITAKVSMGTTPTVNKNVYIYLIRSDGTRRDDGAGASDAALTVYNCRLVGVLMNLTATSNVALQGSWVVKDGLFPEFGIAVVHDCVAALNSTAGNHYIGYEFVDPQAQ